jgi:hypothetical protein
VGVLVTSTINQGLFKGTLLAQTFGEDIYIPYLGLVSFVASVTEDAVGWSEDIRVKNIRQYIPCPFPQGAINVVGNPETGVAFQLTKVYKAIESADLA